MIKIFDNFFYIIYKLYKKTGDSDAFYTATFVLGVLVSTTIYSINILLYIITKIDFFYFNLTKFLIISAVTIITIIFHFDKRQTLLEEHYSKNKAKLTHKILLSIMFSTWFILPYLAKFSKNL